MRGVWVHTNRQRKLPCQWELEGQYTQRESPKHLAAAGGLGHCHLVEVVEAGRLGEVQRVEGERIHSCKHIEPVLGGAPSAVAGQRFAFLRVLA